MIRCAHRLQSSVLRPIHKKDKVVIKMNRSESKYYNTACLMDEALIRILERKDFEYITVKEICDKAGVNRSTFYLHYETMNDLLEESMEYVNRMFIDRIRSTNAAIAEKISVCPMEELYLITPQYLSPYLAFIREQKRLFGTVVRNSTLFRLDRTYEKMFRYIFTPILERFGVPEEERRYIMAFHIRGLMAVIAEWLRTDCRESDERIIEMIQKYIRH